MTIRVALHHRTYYRYDRPVNLGPQTVRLRPAPHCRTPILAYSLKVVPEKHFTNWQQDPQGNYLARLVFEEKTQEFCVDVDLIAEMTVINPFDFFLEDSAAKYPFVYTPDLAKELEPFLETEQPGPYLAEFLKGMSRRSRPTNDFLVEINRLVQERIGYVIRMEPGVQSCEETLEKCSGSCRDSAWLLVQVFRHLGVAARFVSGYLIQLAPDIAAIEGPAGPAADFTDLHAWCEVYLAGAGWIGLDPTSGLLAGEGHLPLACTPHPTSAAPISGGVDECESTFDVRMSVTRFYEDPRVSKPYTSDVWNEILAVGDQVDAKLARGDVRLTMGGEPTFVSIDDMEAEEWTTAALGPTKRKLSVALLHRLQDRYARGGLLQFSQGKWYPGETLPRWAFACYWRLDGEPIWKSKQWIADESKNYGFGLKDAQRFIAGLADRLGVDRRWTISAYEDPWHFLQQERRLPVNLDPLRANLNDPEERKRLARVLEQGLQKPVGCVMPLACTTSGVGLGGDRAGSVWRSGPWPIRTDYLYLLPGESPVGLRLPLDSLPWVADLPAAMPHPRDPFDDRDSLPAHASLGNASGEIRRAANGEQHGNGQRQGDRRWGDREQARLAPTVGGTAHTRPGETSAEAAPWREQQLPLRKSNSGADWRMTADIVAPPSSTSPHTSDTSGGSVADHARVKSSPSPATALPASAPERIVRTAICIEPRQGRLYVFLPPLETLEDFLELIAKIEQTSAALHMPVILEGYPPPFDPRIRHFKVTPDPGVIEVNVQPAENWRELVANTEGLYEDARVSRLGTEKFDLDGRHTGTGGGNHVVLGGPTPADSPFLRRPDLLASLVAYWNNHPSLSYLFSGMFLGPTSQAPRADEGRPDAVYELQLALEQVPWPERDAQGKLVPRPASEISPWLVDRLFRNLLVDVTGNTHRSEFCIDKLYSPDSSTGRLGLVEFRGFEMPPHARMSLTQQLLIRALVANFWERPYRRPLVDWRTALHDRFLLPHFLWRDFEDVTSELQRNGFPIANEWFAPHFEFRFPKLGEISQRDVQLELRQAIEPWYVLGEEPAGGAMARYVDSSVERLQVQVDGFTPGRHVVTCNGRAVPLAATGTSGQFVAGVRYRAWQPPHCLHPNIPIDAPLTFDLVDTWQRRSLGGCMYHTVHPGGRSYATFPINANEAESRRGNRFFATGHSAGEMNVPPEHRNDAFPLTLDLRRF